MKDAVVNKDNSVYANTAEASNTAERLDFSREEMIDHTLSDLSLGQEINIKFYKNGCRARHGLVSKQLFRLIGVITRIQNIQNGKKKL